MTPSNIEAMKIRTSVRTYAARHLDDETRTSLETLCRESCTGPFGCAVRLKLLDLGELPREELRSLGTYGVIKGAQLYILTAVRDEKGAMEDLGFCLEKVIIEATAMALGTCWLPGTFRRSSFARHMDLAEGELLPVITPVGYAAQKASLVERAFRFGAKSRRQPKPWGDLFFHADGKTPLTKEEAGPYRDALKAVRQGPSATNKQPWRMVKEDDIYRLYLDESPRYNRALGKIRIQNIDMGIAMCHFQLAAEELGLDGRWQPAGHAHEIKNLIHIADWIPGK